MAAWCGALFLLPVAPARGEDLEFDFTVVARRGDPAPGAAPGLLFEHFGTQPSLGGALAAPPAVGNEGTVAFHAFLGDGDPGTIEETDRGVWKFNGRSLDLFRFVGDPAPGTGDVFSGFPGPFGHTPFVVDGRLTIIGSVGPVFNPETGIWSERFGSLERVLLTGDMLPDLPAGESIFNFSVAHRGDEILLNGFFTVGNSLGFQNEGLWRNRAGTWETILVKDLPVPGMPAGVVFANDTSQRGPISVWNASETTAVFAGTMAGPHITADDNEAIWVETPSGLQMLVREGDQAPGLQGNVRFGSSTGFRAFGDPEDDIGIYINAQGSLLFGAALHTAQFTRARSIWTTRNGSPEFLVRGFRPLPGNPPGDPAPGFPAGVHFSHFIRGVINDQDEVAFWGFTDSGSVLDPDLGIWWDRPGTITLVAGEGLPVPAIPGATFASVVLNGFDSTSHLWYSGTFSGSGIGPLNNEALFLVEPDGTHSVILREGDPLDFSSTGNGSDPRIVAFVQFGSGITDDNGRVLEVFFTDGSTAIYLVTPRPGVTSAPEIAGVSGFRLELSRPNPLGAGETATLSFSLPAAGPVAGAVYDAGGRRIRSLANGRFEAGPHALTWDGRDDQGRLASAGVYFARVTTPSGKGVRRVVFVR
jgi:hypothetical protein